MDDMTLTGEEVQLLATTVLEWHAAGREVAAIVEAMGKLRCTGNRIEELRYCRDMSMDVQEWWCANCREWKRLSIEKVTAKRARSRAEADLRSIAHAMAKRVLSKREDEKRGEVES